MDSEVREFQQEEIDQQENIINLQQNESSGSKASKKSDILTENNQQQTHPYQQQSIFPIEAVQKTSSEQNSKQIQQIASEDSSNEYQQYQGPPFMTTEQTNVNQTIRTFTSQQDLFFRSQRTQSVGFAGAGQPVKKSMGFAGYTEPPRSMPPRNQPLQKTFTSEQRQTNCGGCRLF